ncbi:hypothetical protein M405DRAFT_843497 [Rhizopogon salebrosus TDB-379]|nr:hypothetical protein M405DRAFT_843497 [Rhizopogon salebrosus TDB-379]
MISMADVPVYMSPGVPVVQPPHLEGLSDPSLSTEILPGPPSLLSVQQAAHKRNPKKPGAFVSYLPASDPGSTYSGLMGSAFSGSDAEGQRRKCARVDKGYFILVPLQTLPRRPPYIRRKALQTEGLNPRIPWFLRAFSLLHLLLMNIVPLQSSQTEGKGRGKTGKGKETEKPSVRVKEEPSVTYSLTPDPPLQVAVTHRWKLWPCRNWERDGTVLTAPFGSIHRQNQHLPSSRPSFIKHRQARRKNFNFLMTSELSSRMSYIDSSEIRQPRLNRHGQIEGREPYHLKDKNGIPVLYFRCGISSLPNAVDVSAKASQEVNIVCPYLYWHLNRLDPPLVAVPPFNKKWMCPNHAEHAVQPKRRVPKQIPATMDITKLRQFNNGNIDIVHPEGTSMT